VAAADDWPVRRRGKEEDEVAARVRRLQELVRHLPVPPPSVDEFIAEKRREARRDL
jgi:hypothetical protein